MTVISVQAQLEQLLVDVEAAFVGQLERLPGGFRRTVGDATTELRLASVRPEAVEGEPISER